MSQIVKTQFRFENLNIYKDSLIFANTVYVITKKFPKEEIFGITNQLRRAAVSISLNIAEGSSRKSKDFAHFLNMAKGSCFECVAIIDICLNEGYITKVEHADLYEVLNKLSRMISSLQTSVRKSD